MSSLGVTLTSPLPPSPRTVCTCISTACSFPVSASCTRTVSASLSASLYIYRPGLGRLLRNVIRASPPLVPGPPVPAISPFPFKPCLFLKAQRLVSQN